MPALASRVAPLTCIQPDEREEQTREARATMERIGTRLIDAKKRELATGKEAGRDLLSLLIRSNMAHDRPESERMSDRDVLGRECALNV